MMAGEKAATGPREGFLAQLRGEEVGKKASGRNGGTEDKGERLWRQLGTTCQW